MSRVTELRLHEDQSCEVWVDGAQLVRTDALLLYHEGIEVGSELTQEDIQRLCTRASISEAKQRAFFLLGYRSYCFAELVERLKEQFEPAVAEAAARRAQELGYIDDTQYAAALARELFLNKQWSVRRASFEMSRRGLPAELIDAQISEYEDREIDRAVAILEKKYIQKLSDPKGRHTALAALQRLGFSYSDAKTALSQIVEEGSDDSENTAEE